MKRLALLLCLLATPALATTVEGTRTYTNGDSAYAIPSDAANLYSTAAFTASRAWTLPCANTVKAGTGPIISDTAGAWSQTYPLALTPKSSGCSDTLNKLAVAIPVGSPHANVIAKSDGSGNWQITVTPQLLLNELDLQRDFGNGTLRPARAINTTDCLVTASSYTVTCANTPIDATDIGDTFMAQLVGSSGNPYVNTVTGINAGSHTLTLNNGSAAPSFGNSGVLVIDGVNPSATGCGYSFGSTQSFSGGTATVAETGMYPALMNVCGARVNTAGSGGTPGSCATLSLLPGVGATARAAMTVAGAAETFIWTIDGSGALTGTPSNDGLAKFKNMASFTYSAGWYLNIPVGGCSLSGATVDIQLGVVTERIANAPNGYTAFPSSPANTTSSDSGTGLTLTWSSHKPYQSLGQDAKTAREAAMAYQNAQGALGKPVRVTVRGQFITTPSAVASHNLTATAAWSGDYAIQSGFFFVPNTAGDLFPCLDCNANRAQGPNGLQLNDPSTYNKGGLTVENLTLQGWPDSTADQYGIVCYGECVWWNFWHLSAWGLKGGLLAEGVDGSNKGAMSEGTCGDIRAEHVGDYANSVPAIAFDGIGVANGSNNVSCFRIREFQPNGVGLALRPCDSGNGIHLVSFLALKIEESGMENDPHASDGVQVGATTSECNASIFKKSDGTMYNPGAVDAGVGGLHIDGTVNNEPSGTYGVHLKGSNSSDIGPVDIDIDAPAANSEYGGAFEVESADNGVVLSTRQCSVSDWCLFAAGAAVSAGGVEFDPHDLTPNVYQDAGVNLMTQMRCQYGVTPPTGCNNASGTIVDTASTQTLANKTLTNPVVSGNLTGATSITSGSYKSGASTGITGGTCSHWTAGICTSP